MGLVKLFHWPPKYCNYMAKPKNKLRLRKGDTVQVLAGRDRGKRGKVLQTFPQLQLVVVEGVNQRVKHLPRRSGTQPGQRLNFNAPLPSGKVALICQQCDKTTRIGAEKDKESNMYTRVCHRCNKPV